MKSKFTRRDFVRGSGAAIFAAAIGTTAFGQTKSNGKLSAPPEIAGDRFASFAVDDFVPYVGEVMRVRASDGSKVQLTLISAEDTGAMTKWRSAYSGPAYSLTFEAPRKVRLSQDVYTFDHYALGSFSLLLAPVGLTGRRFEALINRTHE